MRELSRNYHTNLLKVIRHPRKKMNPNNGKRNGTIVDEKKGLRGTSLFDANEPHPTEAFQLEK